MSVPSTETNRKKTDFTRSRGHRFFSTQTESSANVFFRASPVEASVFVNIENCIPRITGILPIWTYSFYNFIEFKRTALWRLTDRTEFDQKTTGTLLDTNWKYHDDDVREPMECSVFFFKSIACIRRFTFEEHRFYDDFYFVNPNCAYRIKTGWVRPHS